MLKEIKTYCIMRGLNIKELSEQAGVSTQAIYKWDMQCPSIDKVYKVAKVLKCPLEELCKDERFV